MAKKKREDKKLSDVMYTFLIEDEERFKRLSHIIKNIIEIVKAVENGEAIPIKERDIALSNIRQISYSRPSNLSDIDNIQYLSRVMVERANYE